MKFSELKQSLNQIGCAYYLFGEDAFLLDSAQKMIEKHCVKNMPELNISTFNDENFDLEKCLDACQSLPFCDEKRVVVLSDLSFDKQTTKQLEKFLEKQSKNVCVIFKDSQNSPQNKTLFERSLGVDCNELDEKTILSLIDFRLKKHGIEVEPQASRTLIEYCNANMTFVDQELKKLVAFAGENGKITNQDVVTLVHKNIEYAVFELANKVVEKNAQRAYEILDLMLQSKEEPIYLFGMITNVFRRVFYATITKGTNAEIAKMLGVKEFSITYARKMNKNFSPKKLKAILDLASELDFNQKNGKTDDVTALYQLIANCLAM